MEFESKVNILLVDDHEENLVALEAILEGLGQNLVKARSGKEALKHVLHNDFAVILLDAAMPGMDGFETAKLIRGREKSKNIPIIFLTAYSKSDAQMLNSYSLGAADYIFKPLVPEVIKAKVAVFVDLYKKTEEIKQQALLIQRLAKQEREHEREKSLKTLQASEERFWKVFRSLAIGVAIIDLQGRLLASNPVFQSMFSCKPEEINGLLLTDFSYMSDSELGVELYQELAQGRRANYQAENRYLRKDGQTIWGRTTISLIRSGDSEPAVALVMIEDVTARRLAEESLETRIREQALIAKLGQMALSEMNLATFMEELVTGVAQTLNVEFCKILELLEEERTFLMRTGTGWKPGYIGRRIGDASLNSQVGYTLLLLSNEPLIISDLRTETRFWAPKLLVNHEIVSGMSITIAGKEGVYGVLGAYTSKQRVFTNDDINFLKAVATVLALAIERANTENERGRLFFSEQEARKDAESANRIKDEFLAMVSHELRTPVTVILGWAEMLKDKELDEATIGPAIDAIDRNAKLQVQLIEDLLDISRIIADKIRIELEPLDLAPIVEAVIGTLLPVAEMKNIQLISNLNAPVGLITCDPDRLHQVFSNILSNAIKFTPKDGTIEISIERVGSWAHIIVKDTGKGINPKFLPFVFDRFRQADSTTKRVHSGMGLGLAIARHLVELHGGVIRAKSDGEGCGATFIVELPILDSGKQQYDLAQGKDGKFSPHHFAQQLESLRILVVDDEKDLRELLKVTLSRYGAKVKTAGSVAEALEMVKHWHTDLVISDIGMPEEDGYSFIKKLRTTLKKNTGSIPAIALTSYARNEDRERALSAGFQLHIVKPPDPAKLVEAIITLTQQQPIPKSDCA